MTPEESLCSSPPDIHPFFGHFQLCAIIEINLCSQIGGGVNPIQIWFEARRASWRIDVGRSSFPAQLVLSGFSRLWFMSNFRTKIYRRERAKNAFLFGYYLMFPNVSLIFSAMSLLCAPNSDIAYISSPSFHSCVVLRRAVAAPLSSPAPFIAQSGAGTIWPEKGEFSLFRSQL